MKWGDAAFAAVLVGGRDGAMAEAIELAGGRVAASLAWGDTIVAAADAILVLDASDVEPDLLDAELASLAGRAAVVCCTLAELEQVAAALLVGAAPLLCAPSMADRVAALAAAGLAGADTVPALREGSGERLRRFSGEVAQIAATLARLAAEEGAQVAERRPLFDPGPADAAVEPQAIRAALRARRLRDGFFGDGIFEDPAWDMLLDLFAAELEGARVSISSLCIAAAVAPTTALRWINRLVAEGLMERRPDPRDKRRAFVALSPLGAAAMRGYLAALGRNGLALA